MFVEPPFRVPLHSDGKGLGAFHAHRLYKAVGRHAFDNNALAKPVQALSMERVDHHLGRADQVFQISSRCQRQGVPEAEAAFHGFTGVARHAVVHHSGQLVNPVVERSAERHVDFLDAAAASKDWDAGLDTGADQGQYGVVACRITDFVVGERLSAKMVRLDIGAPAGQQQSVKVSDQRWLVGFRAQRWHQEGYRSGTVGHGPDIIFPRSVNMDLIFG